MKDPSTDIGDCPVAACPRPAFEGALVQLILSVAEEEVGSKADVLLQEVEAKCR